MSQTASVTSAGVNECAGLSVSISMHPKEENSIRGKNICFSELGS